MDIPIKIKAHPKPGWRFVRWEGDFPSSDHKLSITLRENAIVYAVFEPYLEPSLVISEIHYNPSAELQGEDDVFEFLELLNRGESRLDISGYHFTDGIAWTFPSGTYINAGEFIVLAKNAATYMDKGFRVFQVFSGNLANEGELLVLSDSTGAMVDRVFYDDHFPWPDKPDGKGPSLELKDSFLDNDLASSWKSSEMIGGTPGTGSTTTIEINQAMKDDLVVHLLPNPFYSTLGISYTLPEGGRVNIKIFNMPGQLEEVLEEATKGPGEYYMEWDPGDLPGGVYFLNIRCGRHNQCKRILYLKQN